MNTLDRDEWGEEEDGERRWREEQQIRREVRTSFCGNRFSGGDPCILLVGHTGAHRDFCGTEWGKC